MFIQAAKVKTCYLNECIENVQNFCHNANEKGNLIIFGDLNVDMLKKNELSNCLEICGLTNIVKSPTCHKGTPTMLDLFLTNVPKCFQMFVAWILV